MQAALRTSCVHRLVLAIVMGWLGIGTTHSQQAKPTDADVDRAIQVCSLGTKTDAKVEGGLNILKRRILSGEGTFSYSEIPSVIGSGVQSDDAKIQLFDRIQKCAVAKVYGTAPQTKTIRGPTVGSHAGDNPADGNDVRACAIAENGWTIVSGSGTLVPEGNPRTARSE